MDPATGAAVMHAVETRSVDPAPSGRRRRASLRDTIDDLSEVSPLTTSGARRVALLVAYVGILLVTFGGAALTAATRPELLLGGLVVCYVVENVQFVVTHVGLHASFVEMPERQMGTITHHSFVHHYRNPRVYHQTWLESRLAYFFCPRRGLRSVTTRVALVVYLAVAAIVGGYDPTAAIAALSCMGLTRGLQTVAHEWYHHDDRAGFYTAPVFGLLTLLERVGVMSTSRHLQHHRHHLHSLDAVHHWTDLYLPGGDALGDALWEAALQRHVPGEDRMVRFVLRVVPPVTVATHAALIAFFLVA
jgi:hypothetical protein